MTRFGKTIQIALLSLAVLMIIAGVLANGHTEVMSKAVTICLECIGIG